MPRKVIGLDAGNSAIKTVEIEKSFRNHEITRKSHFPRVASNGDLTALIKDALGEAGVESDVWTAFPLSEVTARLIRVPFSSAGKLERVIPYELEGSVPFGIEEMIVDHHAVELSKSSSWVLAAGAKRERVAGKLSDLAEAGLNPRGLVPEGYAYRSLARLIKAGSVEPYAFLDIGASHTVLAAGIGDRAAAGRSIPFGGNKITEVLSRKLSVSIEEAEKIKITGGLHHSVLHDAAREALKPLAMQVRNALRFLKAEEGIAPAEIFICGGTARMEKIDELLSSMIGATCRIVPMPVTPGVEFGPEDAQALALALEDVNPVHGVNFRKAEFAYRGETTVYKERLLFPVVLLFLLIVFLNVNSLVKNKIRQEQAAVLSNRISSVVQAVMPGENLPAMQAADKLKEEITRLKKLDEELGKLEGMTPLQALTAISELIPADLNVDLETVNMTEKMVTLEGVIPEHSDMDIIVGKLKGFPAFKRFDTPDLRPKVGGGVKFTLRIFLTEEQGEGEQ